MKEQLLLGENWSQLLLKVLNVHTDVNSKEGHGDPVIAKPVQQAKNGAENALHVQVK